MQTEFTEQELVYRLKSRDPEILEILYQMYSRSLGGVIKRIVMDKALAEDLLQETFIKIWRCAEQYDPARGRLFTWMINIARNNAVDTFRSKAYKKSARNVGLELNSQLIERVYPLNYNQYEAIGITKLLSCLNPPTKEVIRLFYIKGLTHKAIAEQLQQPIGTVKTRLRIGIIQLQKHLARDLAFYNNRRMAGL